MTHCTQNMTRMLFFGLVMATLSGCGGCDDKGKPSSPLVEGTQPGDCNDGADNDGDGLFDCDDDSCQGSPICAPQEEDEAANTDGDADSESTDQDELTEEDAPLEEDSLEEDETSDEGDDEDETLADEDNDAPQEEEEDTEGDDEDAPVICEEGQHDGGDGQCLPEGECAETFILVEGACACPEPFALNPERNDCSAIDPDPAFCNDHGVVTPEGQCECAEGFAGEHCGTCAVGFRLEDEACVAVPAVTCEDHRVNTLIDGDQDKAAIGTTPEGGFIIAWFSQELRRNAIKVQAFDAAGLPSGNELRVDVDGARRDVLNVIGLADGRFSVIYEGREARSIVRTFDANGELLSQHELHVDGNDPVIYRRGPGFAVLMNKSEGSSSASFSVFRQTFNGQGSPNSGLSRLNRRWVENVFQLHGSGAQLDSGAEVTAWSAHGNVFDADDQGRFFHANCKSSERNINHELIIARGINAKPKVAQVAPDGHFAVYWEQAGAIKALFGFCNDRGFAIDSDEPVVLAQGARPIIGDRDGGFTLGFQAQVHETDGADVFVQSFDEAGAATSTPTRIAQAIDGDQTSLKLVALNGGGVQAVWLSDHDGNEGIDVMTRSIETAFCPEVVPCMETLCDGDGAYCDHEEGAASCAP